MHDKVDHLQQLGSQHTEYVLKGPSVSMLETFANPYPGRDYQITHSTEEFTSLCPKTGQPDFGTIKVTYVPDQSCVETKSLKLYLFAYREERTFMERLTGRIFSDLLTLLSPRLLEVTITFHARGGIETQVQYVHKIG